MALAMRGAIIVLEEDVFVGTEDEMALCSNLMEWCERVLLSHQDKRLSSPSASCK